MKLAQTFLTVALVVATTGTFAAPMNLANDVKLSGNISAVSAYVSRGGTNGPENNEAAIQSYLRADLQHFYVAYWGSKLGYSFKEVQDGEKAIDAYIAKNFTSAQQAGWTANDKIKALEEAKSATADQIQAPTASEQFEHDFFVGYANQYQDWSYDLQLASYVYPGGTDTTALEAGVFLSHPIDKKIGNAFSIGLQSYLKDTYYMNQGDTYLELGYSQPLPQGFALDLSSGFSWFQNSGKYEGKGAVGTTVNDFAFRHATVQLSHALFNNDKTSGWVKYIVGGSTRNDIDQDNLVVAGMRYSF